MYIDIDVAHPHFKPQEFEVLYSRLNYIQDLAPSDGFVRAQFVQDPHSLSGSVKIKSLAGYFSTEARASNLLDLTDQMIASLEAQLHTWKDHRFEAEVHRPSLAKHFKKIKKFLVVDDDEDMVRFLSHQLKRDHGRVETCADGFEALENIVNRHYDMMILDWSLPGMNAGELLRKTDAFIDKDPNLSESWSAEKIPVVIVSGHDVSKIHFPETQNFEIVDFWPKQQGPKALINKIRNTVGQNFYIT